MILTDGQIWNQDSLFSFVRQSSADHRARFFSLGIGNAASHSLVEGVARAGNGFSQSVLVYEELSKKVVCMLKGALSPHVYDYKLEVEYDDTSVPDATDSFEIVEDASEADSVTERGTVATSESSENQLQKPISLFDSNYKELEIKSVKTSPIDLPKLTTLDLLQAPWKIPTLYTLVRSTVCILMDPRLSDRNPQAITLRGTSEHGPLELKIPIQNIGKGETIHQIASQKAVVELEENHGWIEDAKDSNGNLVKDLSPETKCQLAIRECQNLGIKYQVTGQHCSFVALDQNGDEPGEPGSGCKEEYAAASEPDLGFAPKKAKEVRGCREGSATNSLPPSRFGGLPAAAPAVQYRCAAIAAPSADPLPRGSRLGFPSPIPRNLFGERSTSTRSPNPPPAAKTSTLDKIIKFQTFEGFWKWTKELTGLLGVNDDNLRSKLTGQIQGANHSPQLLTKKEVFAAVATMLVMGYLERKAGGDKGVWELVYVKAEMWLQMELARMGAFGEVIGGGKESIVGFV